MRTADDSRHAVDRQLVARARAGGPDGRRAAADLLGHYRQRVYAWCVRHVADHELALDMSQEVLLRAYRRLDTYSGRAPFVCWLWTIARNRCLSELRRPRVLQDEEFDLGAVPAEDRRPDEVLEEADELEALRELIATRLEPLEQQALWLRCREGMPVDAITRALGLTAASGARGLLQTARRKLRAALEAARNPDDGTRS